MRAHERAGGRVEIAGPAVRMAERVAPDAEAGLARWIRDSRLTEDYVLSNVEWVLAPKG